MSLVVVGVAVLGLAVGGPAAEPPGSLVIRPGGSGARPVERFPEKAGFLVIRPDGSRTGTGRSAASPILVGGKTAAPAIGTILPAPTSARQDQLPRSKDDGKVVIETWDATFLRGQRVGYTHVIVREYDRDGKTFLYGVKTQKMTVARFGQVVEQWGEDSTLETPEGQVLTTRMRQGIGREQKLSLAGKVKGEVLTVEIEGAAGGGTQEVPFPAGVLGVAKEATLLSDRKPKVGDVIDYLWYEGRLNRVVKFTATVKGVDELALYEKQPPRKYLRVEVAMEPLRDPTGREFRLPGSTVWADAESLEPLKLESDVPSLGGKLTVIRTTKEAALRPVGKVPDLFDVQSIRLDRPIADVHGQAAVAYRVKLTGDLPPEQTFVRDARQTVENVDAAARTFELHVRAGRPEKVEDAAPAGKEFLSDNFFIDWDHPQVRAHAQRAVAALPATASAWDRARAVELWVHQNMKPAEFSQAMATCANVAKSLSGDCTEYAMLAAGMCRALGVPSRTALGVVYATGRDGKPYLAYHMWFEVFADGRWSALDATLGRGGVGPGHLKITDSSWYEEKSFAPLLPVLTVLSAQPKVEVLKVTGPGR